MGQHLLTPSAAVLRVGSVSLTFVTDCFDLWQSRSPSLAWLSSEPPLSSEYSSLSNGVALLLSMNLNKKQRECPDMAAREIRSEQGYTHLCSLNLALRGGGVGDCVLWGRAERQAFGLVQGSQGGWGN